MPLRTVSNRLSDSTHHMLDDEVQETLMFLGLWDPRCEELTGQNCSHLLHVIINTDADKIKGSNFNRKYLTLVGVHNLVKANHELQEQLNTAWKSKSFREIRNLEILQADALSQLAPDPILNLGLSTSFNARYRGAAVQGFHEYLTRNEMLFNRFKSLPNTPPYYAKFCSVVQSSGTGKSRMLTELCNHGVVVIYMNLREKDDQSGYPPRDPIPSRMLTEFSDKVTYEVACYAFFVALFNTVAKCLAKNESMDAASWIRDMCIIGHDTRNKFFDLLDEKYREIYKIFFVILIKEGSMTGGRVTVANEDTIDSLIERLKEITLPGAQSSDQNFTIYDSILLVEYENMSKCLKVFTRNAYEPRLTIAIDEAHTLTVSRAESYRPLDIFCRVISKYSHCKSNHPVWVVFASTTSKVADFSLPNERYNSDCVSHSRYKLFLPYTQLGWDQSAVAFGEIGMENISRLNHIARYGRPLWHSFVASHIAQEAVKTASQKLCSANVFNANDLDHVLAVLGQRFALKIAYSQPYAIEHLEKGVASHLRIGTTLDQNWKSTTYPSEPLLSCVAAQHMHASPDNIGATLKVLLNHIKTGMIDMGQRGELASRFLWLVAKDLFIRTGKGGEVVQVAMPSQWNDHLPDCQMIPVVEWLEFVFGPQVWQQNSHAFKVFESAYVNFSHWVCMETDIMGESYDQITLDEWSQRHWQRTSAVQCSHQKPQIDKVIPMCFKEEPEGGSMKWHMSQILISDKDRTMPSHSVLDDMVAPTGYSTDLPYIAILADLGLRDGEGPGFSAAFPEDHIKDRCLRIYAPGFNEATYPFLSRCAGLMEGLKKLVQIEPLQENDLKFTHYLNEQMKFGRVASATHMKWENWKNVPDV